MASPPQRPDDRGVVEIVEAIIDDTRELVEAHVEALREDMSERVSSLGSTLTSSLLAFSIMIVTALLLGIAVATTLMALGLPAWASFWIVTVGCAFTGVALVRRAQRAARNTGKAATEVADRLKNDVTWNPDEVAQHSLSDETTSNAGANDDETNRTASSSQ